MLRARLERAARADEHRSTLRNKIAALNAPDAGTWAAIQAAGREVDEAQIRVVALALRLEFSAERDLTAHIMSGDPDGPVRVAAGKKVVTRGDGRLTVRLPGIGTIEVSGPTGDAAEWRVKLAEARARLERLLATSGVTRWQELCARVEQRDALSIEWITAEAECKSVLQDDTMADLGEREQQLTAEYSGILAAEPSWAQQAPDIAALQNYAYSLKLAWDRNM